MDIDIETAPAHSPSASSDEDSAMPPFPSCATINTSAMRRTRPWYLLPLVVNLVLIYSSKHLLLTMEGDLEDDAEFPICEWLLYTSVAITSPLFLVMSRLLPDPSMALCIGGIFSSGGLLWASTTTPGSLTHKLAYSLGNGIGISLSMQAITLAISPYFVKEGVQAAGSTLFLSLLAMLGAHQFTDFLAAQAGGYNLHLCLGGLVMVTSFLPPAIHLASVCVDCWSRRGRGRTGTFRKGSRDDPILCDHDLQSDDSSDETLLTYHHDEEEKMNGDLSRKRQSCLHNMGQGLSVIMGDTGWMTSFLSVLVWLTWGAGVDTTWLDIGWTQQVLPYPHRLPSLHLIMGFFLMAVKLVGQHWVSPPGTGLRVNLASNYMHLGLLGCSGVLLCLFPEYSHPLHGSLLFTASLALQYDDLSDLCLIPGASFCMAHLKNTGEKGKEAFSSLVSTASPSLPLKPSPLSSSLSVSSSSSRPLSPSLVKTSSAPSSRSSSELQSFQPPHSSAYHDPLIEPVSQYALVKYSMLNELSPSMPKQDGSGMSRSGCFTLACLLGHSLSLLLMATLSMVLGLQIANLLRRLFTLPPFSFLCSSAGLLVLSSAAIGVSLGKPDVWIGGHKRYTVLS